MRRVRRSHSGPRALPAKVRSQTHGNACADVAPLLSETRLRSGYGPAARPVLPPQ